MNTAGNRRLALVLGSNLSISQGDSLAIRIDGEDVLWLERDADSGKVFVNCRIYSAKGFLRAELMNNVWVHPAKHNSPYFLHDDDPTDIQIVKIEGGNEVFGGKIDAMGRVIVQNAQLYGKTGTRVVVSEGAVKAGGVTMTGNLIVGSNDPFNFGPGSVGIG